MSVPFSSFEILSPEGFSFSYTIQSCNPSQPVSFSPTDPNCHELSGYLGGRYPCSLAGMVVSYNTAPTVPDENPIRIKIFRITSDQGEFTGDSAVLYGYFCQPYAQELGFYLNQQQSQRQFSYGVSGINCTINGTAITLK
jgi:hypothetical protein